MDVQLNFLQHEPTANWFDYFLERQKLVELLSRKPIDRVAAISFCDQFVEQALGGEKELATMEKNASVEKDSVASTQYKVEDLWLCALSCFAACDWDLSLLIKNSNVIRMGSLLNCLIRWAFESEMDAQSRTLLAEDPFKFLNSVDSTSTSHVFFGWLYARWVLKTDLDGRFPAPPARPTVSNPYFSVDQSLLQAERLSQAVLEVRNRMGEAVNFLKRLVDDELIGANAKVEVPGTMCFLPNFESATKRPSLPKADSLRKPSKIAWSALRRKTLFDLIVAHFSAKHFQNAKQFLCKILSYQTDTEDVQMFTGDLLNIDQDELDCYRQIFKMDADNPRDKQASVSTAMCCPTDPLLDFVRHQSEMDTNNAKHVVRLLSAGVCRLSKHQLNRLQENEGSRRALIEELSAELLRFPHGNRRLSKSESFRYVRLCGCIYFLCALLPGFVELLPKLSPQLLESPHSLKTRPLAVLPSVSVSPPPSDEYLKDFISSGPPLWTLMFSFDFATLFDTFAKQASQLLISEQNMVFSPVLAEPILHLSSTAGDKMKLWNQLMLWKLEQLARIGNIPKWKELLNKFVEASPNFRENAALKNFFIYDTVRIELVNWCRDFCRANDSGEFAKRSISIQGLLSSTLGIALNNEHNVFQRFGMELALYLINSRQWRLANERIKAQPLFKTPFTDIAVILEVFLFKLCEERKRDEAYKVVRDVFWKVIAPTFDEIRQGVEFRNALINKNYFLEFLQGIKDPDALGLFFGIAAFLYNFSLTTAPTALIDGTSSDDPFQQMQIASAHLTRAVSQQIFVENHELWQTIRLDEYRNRPLDVPFIKQVLAVLCKQAQIAGPIRVPWLRIRADYAFVCESYDEATRLYLEMLMALQHGLLTMNDSEEMEQCSTDRIAQKMDTDLVYSKIAVALHHLRMPTLAAIIGQMRADIAPHLDMVEHLLRNTPLTVDAGHAYFPLIADIHLMEKMAAAYEKFELPLYQQALLELMPTRAINVNNLPVVLERECMRRRQRFIEIVFRQFGEQFSL